MTQFDRALRIDIDSISSSRVGKHRKHPGGRGMAGGQVRQLTLEMDQAANTYSLKSTTTGPTSISVCQNTPLGRQSSSGKLRDISSARVPSGPPDLQGIQETDLFA